jgi:hypothetical protein
LTRISTLPEDVLSKANKSVSSLERIII